MIEPYVTEGVGEYILSLFRGFRGVCVDVGAYHPFWLNNTWIFERIGWDSYCIEPNPNCYKDLVDNRKHVLQYACGDKNIDNATLFIYENNIVGQAGGTGINNSPKRVGSHDKWSRDEFIGKVKVKVRTLDWLMENEIKQDCIDYLSIDVENSEMAVLRGTDLGRWKPKIIVIENITDSQEQKDYLIEHGYRLVNRMVFNDIYILNSYYIENFGG